jgi:hypothetical protein
MVEGISRGEIARSQYLFQPSLHPDNSLNLPAQPKFTVLSLITSNVAKVCKKWLLKFA